MWQCALLLLLPCASLLLPCIVLSLHCAPLQPSIVLPLLCTLCCDMHHTPF